MTITAAMTDQFRDLPVANFSTCVVLANDFSHRTTDALRNEWTPGKMRILIEALQGQLVTITTDKQTGHTLTNVRLVGVRGRISGGWSVDVAQRYGTGDTDVNVTGYWLPAIGPAIIPVGPDSGSSGMNSVKWTAVRMWSDQVSEAIALARPIAEEQGCRWGAWSGTCDARGVVVRYEPSKNPPAGESAGKFWHATVANGRVG